MDNQKPTLKNAQKYIIEPGKTYGNYKVIESTIIQGSKSRETRWICIYLPTGEQKLKRGSDLKKFLTGEEQEEENKKLVAENKHQMGFRNYLFRTSRDGAEKRNHDFKLTFEEFDNLVQQDCYYCGEHPRPASQELLQKRGNTKQPTFYYNGIDRINSNIGYEIGNCVPCCPKCNYMKNTLPQNEFFKQIIKIYNHLELGSTTIENTSDIDGSEQSTSQANGDGNGEHPKLG